MHMRETAGSTSLRLGRLCSALCLYEVSAFTPFPQSLGATHLICWSTVFLEPFAFLLLITQIEVRPKMRLLTSTIVEDFVRRHDDKLYLRKDGYRQIEFCAKKAVKDHLKYF
jgi:hypothetical protein